MQKEQWKNNTLKEYRLKAGLTQKQVAGKLGMQCENRLSRWEQGLAIPTVVNLLKLCRIYNILPNQLYEWDNLCGDSID
jgi:transcriptional regulator with XRE-family HTH domain